MLFPLILSSFIKSITKDSEDDVLVQRCLDGDKEAEHILAEKYLSRIKTAVSYKLKGRQKEDIEDIVQDTLIEAFSSLRRFRENSKFSTWINQIAHNHCVDYLKQQLLLGEEVPLEEEHPEEGIELLSEDLIPDELLERKELRQQIRMAIEGLPSDYREVVVLRELEGLSYKEIAETLLIDLSTVKSRLYEARKQLRGKLRRIYPDGRE